MAGWRALPLGGTRQAREMNGRSLVLAPLRSSLSGCTRSARLQRPRPPPPTDAGFKEVDGWTSGPPAARQHRSRAVVVDLRRSGARPADGQIDVSNQTLREAEAAYRQAAP